MSEQYYRMPGKGIAILAKIGRVPVSDIQPIAKIV
jgi:hypothetical protein